MKLALITDTHWGVRGDSKEFLDHMIEFYRKVFFPELRKRGIKRIIHLGDIVDRRKYINFVTLKALKEEFIEAAEQAGIEEDILIGNHDIPYRNTNSINAMKETFGKYHHIRLYENPETIEIDGCKILMMPWINPTNYQECFDAMKNTEASIMFGHLEIKGFEMYRGLPSHDGFDPSLFDKFDAVYSGHYHKKSSNGNIHYLGAPYEMTWSDYDCPRGFHIFDTETKEVEYIRNPNRMFHKLWYNDSDKKFEDLISQDFDYIKDTYVKVIVSTKNNPYWFDQWLAKIYAAKPIDVSVVEDHRNMHRLDDAEILNNTEDTLTILKKYVAGVETRVDKKDLDNLILTLYHEAIEVSVEEE